MPRKSRMRGRARRIVRSRKSYMRWPAQRDLGADGHAGPQPELRDRALGARHDRLLAGDGGQVADGGIQRLGVGDRLAQADVDHHLLEARDLHRIGVAEVALQGRHRPRRGSAGAARVDRRLEALALRLPLLARAHGLGGSLRCSGRGRLRGGLGARGVRPAARVGLAFSSPLTCRSLDLLAAVLADADVAPVLEQLVR